MLHNASCNILCETKIPGPTDGFESDGEFINQRIYEGYSINWLIDGLPAGTIKFDSQTDEKFYSVGFDLGRVDRTGSSALLHNHYAITVEYHV